MEGGGLGATDEALVLKDSLTCATKVALCRLREHTPLYCLGGAMAACAPAKVRRNPWELRNGIDFLSFALIRSYTSSEELRLHMGARTRLNDSQLKVMKFSPSVLFFFSYAPTECVELPGSLAGVLVPQPNCLSCILIVRASIKALLKGGHDYRWITPESAVFIPVMT